MIDKEYSIVIKRPLSEVFAYVTDPENIPRWASYIEAVRVSPKGPIGVGSQIMQTVRGREVTWKVTKFEPNAFAVYEADYFYATAEVTYSVETVEDGIKFTIHDKGYRKGNMRLISPLLNAFDIRFRNQQMEIVRDALEGSGE